MIDDLRAELEPLADVLQHASVVGVEKLKKLPYDGAQWTLRAFQRDPFIVAFHDTLPAKFGTFERVDGLYAQKRLVFHSNALDLDVTLRRRGSTSAFRTGARQTPAPQDTLYPDLRPVGKPGCATRRAALIWDVPPTDHKHQVVGTMPVAAKLARAGKLLDDNDWEGGFLLFPSVAEDLIPKATSYSADEPDWDVDSDEFPGAQ